MTNLTQESARIKKSDKSLLYLSPKQSRKNISYKDQSPSHIFKFPNNEENIKSSDILIPIPTLSVLPTATKQTSIPSLSRSTMIFDPLLLDDQTTRMQEKPDLHVTIPCIPENGINRKHSKSRSMDLSELMVSISSKPKIGNQDSQNGRMEDHMATLGTRIQQSKDFKKKNGHKRWSSLDLSTIKGAPFRVHVEKPRKSPQNDNEQYLPQLVNGSTIRRSSFAQPNSNNNRSLFKAPPRVSKDLTGDSLSQLGKNTVISFADKSQEKLRTSELDPFPHQVDLPTFTDVSINAELCSLLDNYRNVDQNFDFKQMVGLSRLSMEAFVRSGIVPSSCSLVNNHCPIVKSILECTDDLMVEDFFAFGKVDDVDNRVEVAIFKSESRREIITVWRGTTDAQTKPVKNREVKNFQAKDVKEHIFPSFYKAYYQQDLEAKVFARLEILMQENPFFDLVTTGFSQGAALATICASQFASSYAMMRVSCIVFGSPKVGCEEFRLKNHSLPNLKIVRIQTEDDPFVNSPADTVFVHVGHTILLSTKSQSTMKPHSPPNSPRHVGNKKTLRAVYAYKFNTPPQAKSVFSRINKITPTNKKSYQQHSVNSYVNGLKSLKRLELPWPNDFVGENVGTGVQGMKNEKRNMV